MKRVMKLLLLLLIFKRVYSRSVVFLVNAVNRNTTSLSYSKKSSACQHLQESRVMRKNLPSGEHLNPNLETFVREVSRVCCVYFQNYKRANAECACAFSKYSM